MNDNIEYLKDEIEEFEYLKDEIEELITDNYEDLKIKNIVISRNIFKETQIIITFKEAEKLLPELKRMLIFFDKNYDDYHPEPSCTTQADDRGGPSDERGTISGG